MPRGKYRADNSLSGMGGFILKDANLQDAMNAVAEDGAAYAESIAPVGETGVYATSFDTSEESGRPDSVGAMIFNDAPHAATVEFQLTHTLAKTADYLNRGMGRPA